MRVASSFMPSTNLVSIFVQNQEGACIATTTCINDGKLPDRVLRQCLDACPTTRPYWSSLWSRCVEGAGTDPCPEGFEPQQLAGSSVGVCAPVGCAQAQLQGTLVRCLACTPGLDLVSAW